jgi:hypothetical protein
VLTDRCRYGHEYRSQVASRRCRGRNGYQYRYRYRYRYQTGTGTGHRPQATVLALMSVCKKRGIVLKAVGDACRCTSTYPGATQGHV